jgi:hypothetical protein
MKTLATSVLILGTVLNSRAEAGLENKVPVVLAYVRYNPGKPSVQTLRPAEGLASQMLAKGGVQVIWHAGRPAVKRGEAPILIDISTNTPVMFHRGALAYARPFDGAHVTVFWDRLMQGPDSAIAAGLLAHVLAHEITHILQGTNHHSREGIMKAHWTLEDILQMPWKPLSFDPEDVRLIRLGLAARSSATGKSSQRVSPIHPLARPTQ